MARKGGAPENLQPVRTKDEATKRGRNGGIKSGEARRKKRDAKNAMKCLLDLAATGQIDDNLKNLGLDLEDRTNMMALQARLFTMAMGGNLQAYDRVLKVAGYDPEENRKERESKAAEKRRDAEEKRKEKELQARLEHMEFGGGGYDPDPTDPENEEGDDVLIVLPYNNRPGGQEPKFINPEDIPKG